MEYRSLGYSDFQVSVITFGSWAAGSWMWGRTERKDAIEAIRAAYHLGVTSIDTAPIYGQGDSEEIVGEAIKDIPRHEVQILTKYGMRWDMKKGNFYFKSKDNNGKDIDIYRYAGRESIMQECENSLRRLKTDYIDLYQIHWPDPTTPLSETFEAIDRLIGQGKIRCAGVCNYDVALMSEAEKTVSLVSNQIPFSMVNRGVEKEVIPYCIKHHKAILAYSPLERGLLTGKIEPGHHFVEGDHRSEYFTPENIVRTDEMLKKLKPLAAEKGATLAQLVLRWTIDHPGITIALVGARNAAQAIENAKAVNVKLTKEDIAFIDNAVAEWAPK